VRDELEIPPPGYRVARHPARVDPATRRLATIAAGIGGALVVLVGLWSMIGGSSTGIPVVAPPAGPMRVVPTDPGGMKVAGANEQILGGGAAASNTAALAPPPETPDLRALQNPPPAAQPATAATAAPGAPAAAAPTALAPSAVAASHTGLPLPPPAPPPIQFAAASTAPPPPAAVGTGTATEVQLAALNSQDAAMRAWQGLQNEFPALFDSRQPLVSKVDVDGHTFWRLRTGGFANIAEATSFCAAVRAKGKGCAIAAF
jgi:SPOR domain